MKKLALVVTLGAASLLGVIAAGADPVKADSAAKARAGTDASQPVDISSRHRHWRHRHWHHRHWHHGWRPYYRSYGYYPYASRPVVSFSFGPRWHHRPHHYW